MKSNKLFGLFGILAVLVLTLSLASALTLTTTSAPTTVNSSATSFQYTLNVSNDNTMFSADNITFSASATNGAGVSVPVMISTLASNASTLKTFIVNFSADYGTIVLSTTATGIVNGTPVTSNTNSITVSIIGGSNTCSNASADKDLSISDFTIDNSGEGDDEEWYPLDSVTIEVEVENNNNDDSIGGVYVELLILDENNNDVTDDFDMDDSKVKIGTIKDGDSKIATFNIPSISADVEGGDYRIFAKAYKSGDEQSYCDDNSDSVQEISVTKDDDRSVIFKQADLEKSIQATCGQTVLVSLDVYNIGTEKEDNVLVTIANKELGLNQAQLLSDLRKDDSDTVNFEFTLPANLAKSSYTLDLMTYFEYNDDDDEDPMNIDSYDTSSDDTDKDFKITLKVSGCANTTAKPTISASIVTENPKVDEPMEVTVTFLNNGAAATYVMSLAGYESWAKDVSINPATATIAQGSSQTFTLKLTPTKEGVQNFTVRGIANNQIVEQPMQVTIESKSGAFGGLRTAITNITGTEDNTVFYLIVGIFLVLIVLILILIIKALSSSGSKKRRKDDEDEED